jgi:hypothetical protein
LPFRLRVADLDLVEAAVEREGELVGNERARRAQRAAVALVAQGPADAEAASVAELREGNRDQVERILDRQQEGGRARIGKLDADALAVAPRRQRLPSAPPAPGWRRRPVLAVRT